MSALAVSVIAAAPRVSRAHAPRRDLGVSRAMTMRCRASAVQLADPPVRLAMDADTARAIASRASSSSSWSRTSAASHPRVTCGPQSAPQAPVSAPGRIASSCDRHSESTAASRSSTACAHHLSHFTVRKLIPEHSNAFFKTPPCSRGHQRGNTRSRAGRGGARLHLRQQRADTRVEVRAQRAVD